MESDNNDYVQNNSLQYATAWTESVLKDDV